MLCFVIGGGGGRGLPSPIFPSTLAAIKKFRIMSENQSHAM
jgi:hypothetical protein